MKARLLILFLCCVCAVSAWAAPRQLQLQLDRTDPKRTTVGALTFRGAVVVPPGPFKLGGLSGLVFHNGGLVALSDDSRVYRAEPQWEKGRLVGVAFAVGQRLRDTDGTLPSKRARYDAEALVRRADGSWLVAYERDHRIVQFAGGDEVPTGVPVPFATPPGVRDLPRNSGLESLTELPDGRLLALAEAVDGQGTHPGWLWQNGHWEALTYRSASGFAPSDVTALPNGDALVLERGFNFLFSFRTRLVRVPAASLVPGATLTGETLAVLESPTITENFEGVAVEPRPAGEVRIYLVSDNNFNAAQETILAAFDLNATPSRAP